VIVDGGAKRKLAAGAAAAVIVLGGGAAFAANRLSSPREESQAVIADAAKQLGIEPAKLSGALKKALENRVDAAVKDGRLSKEQGDELKARIEAGDVPLFPLGARGPDRPFGHGGPFHHGEHHFPGLDTAATYLGLTEDQLRTELENGKTLAQIAKEHGKTADGLVNTLLDAAKKKLDAAVAAGRLTRDDADSALAGLKDRITNLVNGRFPAPRFDHPFRGDHFRSGPPPLLGPPPTA
jgi:hypothetical protein